jgi:hypothetical protein
MNDQIITLTCQGNAFLRGLLKGNVFPEAWVYQFCAFVRFYDGDRRLADDPDAWFECLKAQGVTGLVVGWEPSGDSNAPDHQLAAFANGGGQLSIGARRPDGFSDYWAGQWQVGDRQAPDRRIWRVTYQKVGQGPTALERFRRLHDVARDLAAALHAIRAFSQTLSYATAFTDCFERALATLEGRGVEAASRYDMSVPGLLPPTAERMLRAASHAWVFGGMGSWNDMLPDDSEGYNRVSASLYAVLQEAITTAASSSCPGLVV